jgi:hypothetical protein
MYLKLHKANIENVQEEQMSEVRFGEDGDQYRSSDYFKNGRF